MCGFVGIVDFTGRPVARGELDRMNGVLAHRGPDGEGTYCRDNVGMAHRRLAIIDPEGGKQPFFNDDGSIVLSYNGEVYNYVELRNELNADFHFRTHSDTEVVMRSYEKWGMACIDRFRGMFAFAIYDHNKDRLYLVRDRVGIKPLFYHRSAGRLVFSSEIHAILCADDMKRQIAPESLSGFFRYQYVPTPATIYKDLYKLEPGHYLEVNTRTGRTAKHKYWDLTVGIIDRPEAEWLEEVNSTLDDIGRIYVRSDVPFGAFLSGGVDSSLVTAVMAKHLASPVRTFSIGFNEKTHSELPYAAEASRVLKTSHYEKIVSPDLAEALLADLVVHFGEPFGDSSLIPTYYVSQVASGEVKMVLSGDGGDELFGGYNSYPRTFRDFTRVARRVSWGCWGLVGRHAGWAAVRKWACTRRMLPYQREYDAQRQILDDGELGALLAPDVPVVAAVPAPVNVAGGDVDPVTLCQAQDFKTYLVDDILTKVDRTSMANSLEVRVPLLDHKLVELAFSLPLSLKIRTDETAGQVETKYLLKKSAERFYTKSFLRRPKHGFGIPVVEWCRGPLRPLIEAELLASGNPVFEWIRFNYVQKMLKAFFSGNDGMVVRVWLILMFALWMKHVHRA